MKKLYLLYDYVFPTFVVPNASAPELTIINYLSTQFNSGRSTNTCMETDPESPHSPLKTIFGKSLYGTWPASLRHGGTRLGNHCFHNLFRIEETSLFFGKDICNRYIYPIKLSPHIADFIGVADNGSKLNGEYFWKFMSAEALKDAQEGRAFIFLDYGEENYMSKETYKEFHDSLLKSQIPASQIIFAMNGFNSKEVYEQWFPVHERKLTVVNWPYMMFYNSWHYANNLQICMNESIFNKLKGVIRPNYFLFRNRRGRSHRIAILYSLLRDNLLDKGDWSFLDSVSEHTCRNSISNYRIPNIDEDKLKSMLSSFPKQLQGETDARYDNIGGWSDCTPDSSTNSYFDITTETFTYYENLSFTEKVCKPMVNFLPFIFIGFKGALAKLRELGFKTFSPFIDESYDGEPDEVKRLQMAYAEIKRLCLMSKEEIHQWYWQMEDILIHNHHTFLSYHTTDKLNLELVNFLDRCVNPK